MSITERLCAQLRLQAWLSPAFPTGGFAYSHGIEWAVETGDIRDLESLRVWVDDVLRLGSGRTDAILLRHAHRAASGPAEPMIAGPIIAELARACGATRERLLEATGQGNAFAGAVQPWYDISVTDLGDLPYCVAVGLASGRAGVDEDTVAAGMLQAFAANLISAAVRLVPLGQSAGLRVLASLEATILAVVAETRTATLDDIGGACFRSDIAAMRHETQYTRLFRS